MRIRIIVCAVLGWIATVGAGDCSYRNPVVPGEFPDPSVIRVGKDYYAAATAGAWAPLFSIAHSTDLVHWRFVGAVFDEQPAWSVSNYWAPELVQYRDRTYVYYTARNKDGLLCVAAASADKPTGPYADHGPLVCQVDGSIDAAHFVDTDGQRYLIWKEDGNSRRVPTPIWIQPLAEDGFTLLGAPREMIRNDRPWEAKVVEGPYLMARNGWYYLFYSGGNCCDELCNYALGVARSRSLQGPWHKHPDNPILAGTEEWRCPGHGTIVEAADGRTFLLYHGFTARDFLKLGRYGLLDEVVWPTNGWPAINSAQGPSVLAEGPEIEVADAAATPANDDFGDSVLPPLWQWPIGQRPHVRVGASTDGWLELQVPSGALRDEAILAQRAPPGRYAVSTLVDIAQLHDGESAGLGAYANAQQLVALTAADGALTLWSREGGRELVLARVAIAGAKQVYLRMIRTSEAGYRFAYKIAAEKWRTVVTLSGTDAVHKPASNPTRIVVLTRGPVGATGRFNYVRLERW